MAMTRRLFAAALRALFRLAGLALLRRMELPTRF
jgi:hypothetical protein